MADLVVLTHTPAAGLSAWRPVLRAGIGGAWRELDAAAGQPLPRSLDAVAALLVLGGTMSVLDVDDHPWMAREQALLAAAVDAEVPVLGVCLGAQLLGSALGGEVRRRPATQVATLELTRTPAGRSDPVVSGWHDHLPGLFAHQDEVAPLPPGAAPLLRGGEGVPAWRFGSAIAVQFHPEVDAATLAGWITDPV